MTGGEAVTCPGCETLGAVEWSTPRPRPGDVIRCPVCGDFLVFDVESYTGSLTLRFPTWDEQTEVARLCREQARS